MNRQIARMALGALAVALVATGCITKTIVHAEGPVDQQSRWVKSEIYFGRDLPGGQQISKEAWADFMDKVVTPRFPKGLTVYDAYGQMQHASGRIEKQSTWVVVILRPKDPAIDQAIQEVIDAFRKQFSKAQVAYVNSALTSASFYAD